MQQKCDKGDQKRNFHSYLQVSSLSKTLPQCIGRTGGEGIELGSLKRSATITVLCEPAAWHIWPTDLPLLPQFSNVDRIDANATLNSSSYTLVLQSTNHLALGSCLTLERDCVKLCNPHSPNYVPRGPRKWLRRWCYHSISLWPQIPTQPRGWEKQQSALHIHIYTNSKANRRCFSSVSNFIFQCLCTYLQESYEYS